MLRFAATAVAFALGWSVFVATPAGAADGVSAELDGSKCGIVVITVHNDLNVGSEYRIFTGAGGVVRFPIAADETRVHRIRVADGARVVFLSPQTGFKDLTYDAADGCPTAALSVGGSGSCVNGLVRLANNGTAPALGVRLLADGAEVLPLTEIAIGGTREVIVTPRSPRTEVDIEVQQQADDPSGQFFPLVISSLTADPAACRGHEATIEDTCSGIRFGVVFPDGPSDLVRVFVGSVRQIDNPAPGQRVDVPVEAGTLLIIIFVFPNGGVDADYHRHTRPASCPGSPEPPPGSPEPTPGSPEPTARPGGGLPVTGASTMAVVGLGAGLLVLGAALALATARRRRTAR